MENMYSMCAAFYGELEKSELRPLFPEDMKESSKKTAEFLTGIMGGPPVYMEKHGHPRMRARHISWGESRLSILMFITVMAPKIYFEAIQM